MKDESNDFASLNDEIEKSKQKQKRRPMFYVFRHNYKKLYKDEHKKYIKEKSKYSIACNENGVIVTYDNEPFKIHNCNTELEDKIIKNQQDCIVRLESEIFELKYKLATLCDSKIKELK
jgi:hypothetical protein